MKKARGLKLLLSGIALILMTALPAWSDVVPGDVIDASNWQKIKGMVPESVLEWVKKGEWVLNIGELTYNPRDYYTVYKEEALKANMGKY